MVGSARVHSSSETRAVGLGWQERYSRRFHGLSDAGLNKLIASLLAAQYRRGEQAPLDVDAGTIQRLCAATRCLTPGRRSLRPPLAPSCRQLQCGCSRSMSSV